MTRSRYYLGNDVQTGFSEAASPTVIANDHAKVEVHADGRIIVHRGRVGIVGTPDRAYLLDSSLIVGQRMPDGMIYAGISPVTGKAVYTSSCDVFADPVNWMTATRNRGLWDATPYHDWRLPREDELTQLFKARAAIGGFQRDWYWAAENKVADQAAYAVDFTDGDAGWAKKMTKSRVRYVRP